MPASCAQPVLRLAGEQAVADVRSLPAGVVDEIEARAGAGRASPRSSAAYRSWSSRSRMFHDQSSPMMWCITSTRTWSSAPRRIRRKRCSGPVARLKGCVGDAPGMALRSRVAFALRDLRQIELDDVGRLHRADEGRGFGVHEIEGRAKRLVPGDQAVEGPAQRGAVQRPAQAHGVAHVVGGALRVHLVQHPHAPLRERQRQGP